MIINKNIMVDVARGDMVLMYPMRERWTGRTIWVEESRVDAMAGFAALHDPQHVYDALRALQHNVWQVSASQWRYQ